MTDGIDSEFGSALRERTRTLAALDQARAALRVVVANAADVGVSWASIGEVTGDSAEDIGRIVAEVRRERGRA